MSVSHRLDSALPVQSVGSWGGGVLNEGADGSPETLSGDRACENKCTKRPCAFDNEFSAEVQHRQGCADIEAKYRESPEG